MLAATRSPVYWAMKVPQAMPLKPIPLKPVPGTPIARNMLARMLIPFTTRSVSIELKESCIPMNQPLKAMRLKVAGAAHILM